MGYYTNFELSVLEGEADLNDVLIALKTITECADMFDLDGDQLSTADAMKWYDHDEDCAEMSKRFPGVVFKLHGEGEENGDMWNAYFKDGLCQICRGRMMFPSFDSHELKPVWQAQQEDSGRD